MPDTGERFVFADEDEAQAACVWWQKQLRLQDWRVDVKIAAPWEFVRENKENAEIAYNLEYRTATLRVLSPAHYEPANNPWGEQDHEEDIVHELCHLYTITWKDHKLEEEQVLNVWAKALVDLRRLAYPEKPWRVAHVP